jgi:DMSO/TMAO reductase YedYZ heme-binding membrane subunit
MSRKLLRTIFASILILSICTLMAFINLPYNEETTRILIRYSAKVSATLFCIAFVIGPIHYFLNTTFTKQLLSMRPNVGLAFATVHFYHLLSLIFLQQVFHPVFTLAKYSSLFAGGMAYLFVLLLAITTFPNFKKRLSNKQWKLLHTIGAYWIWVIFFNSYFGQVQIKETGYFLFAFLVIVLLLRIALIIHMKFIKRELGQKSHT